VLSIFKATFGILEELLRPTGIKANYGECTSFMENLGENGDHSLSILSLSPQEAFCKDGEYSMCYASTPPKAFTWMGSAPYPFYLHISRHLHW
jgi:hypothetical protein